jgi:hypothetical protein
VKPPPIGWGDDGSASYHYNVFQPYQDRDEGSCLRELNSLRAHRQVRCGPSLPQKALEKSAFGLLWRARTNHARHMYSPQTDSCAGFAGTPRVMGFGPAYLLALNRNRLPEESSIDTLNGSILAVRKDRMLVPADRDQLSASNWGIPNNFQSHL